MQNIKMLSKDLGLDYERTGTKMETYKGFLPVKSKQPSQPHFIWIEALIHDNLPNNLMRQKCNNALQTAAHLEENIWSLHLKKVWNPHNHSLYRKFNEKYSLRVSRPILKQWTKLKYADTILLKPYKLKLSPILHKWCTSTSTTHQ